MLGIHYRISRFRNKVLSLSLSLTRIRDSKILFRQRSQVSRALNYPKYDVSIKCFTIVILHRPNYPFFHQSCKTSLAINTRSSFPCTLWMKRKESERNFRRAMNIYDSPTNVSRIRFSSAKNVISFIAISNVRVPIKPVYIHRLNHPCWNVLSSLHYGWPNSQ